MNPGTDPLQMRIRMMAASQRCLILGLLALLPLIGLMFGLAALYASFSARKLEKHQWNPARSQRIIGLWCGSAGTLAWSILNTIIFYQILNNYISG